MSIARIARVGLSLFALAACQTADITVRPAATAPSDNSNDFQETLWSALPLADAFCSGGTTLSGTVLNDAGQAVANTYVRTSLRTASGDRVEGYTDTQGRYCFSQIENDAKLARYISECALTGSCRTARIVVKAKTADGKRGRTPEGGGAWKVMVPTQDLVDTNIAITGVDFVAPGAAGVATCSNNVSISLLPGSTMDLGWGGFAQGIAIPSGVRLTSGVSCTAGSNCSDCRLTGLVDNSVVSGASRNQRCVRNTAIRCSNDSQCGTEGPCRFMFAPVPFISEVNRICSISYFDSPVAGTIDLGSLDATINPVTLKVRAYQISDYTGGPSGRTPCSLCQAAPDGANRCTAGRRAGQICGADGSSVFGDISLDCPPEEEGTDGTIQVHHLTLRLPEMKTSVDSALTLTEASLIPRFASTHRAACSSCSGDTSRACSTNADCVDANGTSFGTCTVPTLAATSCSGDVCEPINAYSAACNATAVARCSEDNSMSCASTPGEYDTCEWYGKGTCTAAAPRSCFGGLDVNARAIGGGALVGDELLAESTVLSGTRARLGAAFCAASSNPTMNSILGLPGPSRTQLRLSVDRL